MEQAGTKSLWSPEHAASYEASNYGPGLAGHVMRKSHALIEKEFGADVQFGRVLEVGAGSGVHIRYVRHRFDEYIMSDASAAMLEQIPLSPPGQGKGRVSTSVQDATKLDFADNSLDRLIATHVLEHIYRPHEVLAEWLRVVRPGGVVSLVLPCDPGLAWRLGRHLGPRKNAEARGLSYDYVMALEHVNPIGNLTAIIEHLAPERRDLWWPCGFASSDLNLIYGTNIRKGEA